MRDRPRVLTVTVTDCSPESLTNVDVLLSSLSEQQVDVEMILVERGGSSGITTIEGGTLHTVQAPMEISLSCARNLALAFADKNGLLALCDLVAFPDDDASYPSGTLRAAAKSMTAHGADVLCGVYLPGDGVLDTNRFPSIGGPLTPAIVPRIVSSNDMFLSGRAAADVGGFDERFGLGARFGSSEDIDFVFRALFAGHRGWYDPAVSVYHPYKSHRPAEYFGGSLAVISTHVLSQPRLLGVPLCRQLQWGAHLVRQRDLRLTAYLKALGGMLVALRSPPPATMHLESASTY